MLLVVLLDQITKFWAVTNLTNVPPPTQETERFFMFTLVYNDGGAMGTSLGSSTYYLISSSLILLFVLYYAYINRDKRSFIFPLALISGGAIGNIIDRVRIGKVIDFIDVDFFDINLFGYVLKRWWTFNIADAAISCSIVFLILHLIFSKENEKNDELSGSTMPKEEIPNPPSG